MSKKSYSSNQEAVLVLNYHFFKKKLKLVNFTWKYDFLPASQKNIFISKIFFFKIGLFWILMIFIKNRLDWEETYSHTIFWQKNFCQKFLHVQKFLSEISIFSILVAFKPSGISGRNFCLKLLTSLKKNFSKTSSKHISVLWESINKPLSYWNSRKF